MAGSKPTKCQCRHHISDHAPGRGECRRAMGKLVKVVEAVRGTEKTGSSKGAWCLYAGWDLKLECGHTEWRRITNSMDPPKSAKCHACETGEVRGPKVVCASCEEPLKGPFGIPFCDKCSAEIDASTKVAP